MRLVPDVPGGGQTFPRLTQAQYDACFALTHVATNASHDFGPPVGTAVTVPVTVWIVRRLTGANPARDADDIPGLLADANKILWQNGLTLVQSGAVRYLNNDSWQTSCSRQDLVRDGMRIAAVRDGDALRP